jgi:PKD repeat protein
MPLREASEPRRWGPVGTLVLSVVFGLAALVACKDVTLDRKNQAPVALPSATPANGPAPLTVAFKAVASDPDGTVAGYQWTFGDGATSSLQNPTHLYAAAGAFTATLEVTDNTGAKTQATVDIAVNAPANQPPTATASATPTAGKAPLAVAFTGGGADPDGTIASYAWTFGDGGTSNSQSPTHTYQTGGNFTATLTVTDNGGAKGSTTVAITAGNNQPPTANASAAPTSGKAPLAVAFTGSGSDADGTIASYAWTFGDGGTAAVQNPAHTYQAAGNYTATLTVTDNNGATGTSSVAIGAVANRPPTATASATPTSGLAPLAVGFTGSGSDSDGTVASYAWTFGDGGTSSLQNPAHSYVAAGNFTATLTVTDNNGATGSSSVAISASSAGNQPPTATASATPTSGKAPLIVAFTGSGTDSDGTISSYSWTFGDGGTSNAQNPSHTYLTAGNYTATLTVTDNGGAPGSATVGISAASNQPPTAHASAAPTSGTSPLPVTFTGSGTDSDGTIASYAWAFGDGGTSTLQNPAHTYASAGSYTATLTVTDNNGATGGSTVGITVTAATNQLPIANAGPDQINLDPGVTVLLNGAASSDPDGSITSYQWTQTAGATVTLSGANTATPSFVAPAAATATYTFTLTVTDNASPQGSAQDAVTVTTRVTYVNLVKSMIDARANQPNGSKLGCTQSSCHSSGGQTPPLLVYTDVFNNRAKVRSKIQSGQSMRQYLLTGEPAIITSWIDNGAPEKN